MKSIIPIILTLFLVVANIQAQEPLEIKYPDILKAMRTQTGYNRIATTNVGRFQASVLLQVAKNSLAKNPDEKILYLDNKEWYKAYKELTGYSDEEMPDYSHRAVTFDQNQLLDLRRENIYSKIKKGRAPEFAINAVVGWRKTPDAAEYYTFNDTLSDPTLEVQNSRIISYRILDFGDMIVYDEMQGLSGQPTSGILGFIFKLIGKGHVMWSRFTITQDGIQVNRARAKKGIFEIESTLTIYPDGTTLKNLPKDREDLEIYEKLLTQPLDIKYVPLKQEFIDIICGE